MQHSLFALSPGDAGHSAKPRAPGQVRHHAVGGPVHLCRPTVTLWRDGGQESPLQFQGRVGGGVSVQCVNKLICHFCPIQSSCIFLSEIFFCIDKPKSRIIKFLFCVTLVKINCFLCVKNQLFISRQNALNE